MLHLRHLLSNLNVWVTSFIPDCGYATFKDKIQMNVAVADATDNILTFRSQKIPLRQLSIGFYLKYYDCLTIGKAVARAMATHNLHNAEFVIVPEKKPQYCRAASRRLDLLRSLPLALPCGLSLRLETLEPSELDAGDSPDPPLRPAPPRSAPSLSRSSVAPPPTRSVLLVTLGCCLRGEEQMGVYLSTPKTDKLSADGENSRVRFGLSSMQGWRTTMEDAHAALPDLDDCTSFFGVYDGHGGKGVSKFCARHLHKQVLINDANSSGDLPASVHKAFLRMDEMMKGQRGWRELTELGDKGNKISGMLEGIIWTPKGGDSDKIVEDWDNEEGPNSNFPGPTSGSTACVAVIRNDQLIVANAGDSRCVISRKGQAYNLSTDHKPDLEEEKERILGAGGFVVAGRVNGSLNLSRAIGDMELKQNELLPAERQIVTAEPELKTVQLSEDDEFIVLACDGIWDCMSSQEVVDFVHKQLKTEDKLSNVCEKLLNRCVAPTSGGEGCDNMTVIVVQFKKPTSAVATSSTEQSAATAEEMRPNELEGPDSPPK